MIPSTNEHAPTFWAAPDLAKAGYSVFPVARNDKRPSVEGGFYAATTEPSEIAAWIDAGREHDNIAMPTGVLTMVVVIEADTPERYAEMEERYGPPVVKTQRGGHWWFRHPRKGKVISNKVRDGLDRKGDGGYVLLPPSLGRTWTNGIPRTEDLTVLPREFWTKRAEPTEAERSMPQDRKEAASSAIAARVASVRQGDRHEHLKHLCGVLLSRDVAFGDAEDILVDAWTKVGGELAERAPREVPNTLRTTLRAIAESRATGVPKLEEVTPGLYDDLAEILGWVVGTTSKGKAKKEKREKPKEEKPGAVAVDGEGDSNEHADRRNQADRLIGYALEDLESLFVDQHGAPHALVGGEPLPLTSRCYSWLRRLMWDQEERAVNGEYLKTVAGTLAAHAEFSGEAKELHTRAAWHEGILYYELRPGKVVRVGPGGWTFNANPPVLFRRFPNLKPLPDPSEAASGSMDDLASYANLKTSRDKRLFTAYAVTVVLPHVGRPILNASGAMGSGKTTIGRLLKRLVDPTAPETVRLDPRDFLQKASHAFLVMLDNQNTVPEWAADTLCRLVTGEADSKRRLYTDDEDVIIELRRAVLLNGINVPTDRGDVLDRSLVVELERIPDTERKTEEDLWERFEHQHPRLLGALFDALAKAIALKPPLELSRRPRLADWGEYAAAVYEVMGWGAETFLEDWDEVVKVQNQATLDGSPVAQAIIKFMEDKDEYTAASSELHGKLKSVAAQLGVNVDRDKAWPQSARWLWRRIKEVLPLLVDAGIEASRGRNESTKRITLRRLPENDGSNGSGEKRRTGKGEAPADSGFPDDRLNGRNVAVGRSNGSQEAAEDEDSADTADTAIRNGASLEPVSFDLEAGESASVEELRARRAGRLSSGDVRSLFAKPPGWLRDQIEHCRQNQVPEQLKALAAAVAAHLSDDATRGSEVLATVEAQFHGLDCNCEECCG